MKFLRLFIFFLPLCGLAQQTINSVQNGNASNPLTWDCICFPSTDDNVIVHHAVTMDVSWLVNGSGSITVNSSGSLIQNGLRDLLVDGAGSSYINHGTSAFNRIAYTNGSDGMNDGHFIITEAAYFGPGTSYTSSGTIDQLDSLLTEGTFTNTGDLMAGNFLNTGTFTNSGPIASDSVGNTGTFNATGSYMFTNAFGNSGTFTMSNEGFMDVYNNWFNIGDFTLGAGLTIFAHEDFYNGDSLGGLANLHNNGIIEVGNDFFNGFNVDGSGNFCVANDSYNIGALTGTFDFCDNTGIDFDWNSGSIAGTITYCSPGCYVSVEESENFVIEIYPNPSGGILQISGIKASTFTIFDLSGKTVMNGKVINQTLDLNNLENGSYILELTQGVIKYHNSIVIQH